MWTRKTELLKNVTTFQLQKNDYPYIYTILQYQQFYTTKLMDGKEDLHTIFFSNLKTFFMWLMYLQIWNIDNICDCWNLFMNHFRSKHLFFLQIFKILLKIAHIIFNSVFQLACDFMGHIEKRTKYEFLAWTFIIFTASKLEPTDVYIHLHSVTWKIEYIRN